MDLTSMSRSLGPGVGVWRGLTSKTPAAFEGRMAAGCWPEDMMMSREVARFWRTLVDRFGRMKCT